MPWNCSVKEAPGKAMFTLINVIRASENPFPKRTRLIANNGNFSGYLLSLSSLSIMLLELLAFSRTLLFMASRSRSTQSVGIPVDGHRMRFSIILATSSIRIESTSARLYPSSSTIVRVISRVIINTCVGATASAFASPDGTLLFEEEETDAGPKAFTVTPSLFLLSVVSVSLSTAKRVTGEKFFPLVVVVVAAAGGRWGCRSL
mmetsp:Transcript_11927/g.25265  ORF Transcript_11927/g.25265 Transcript_11927/m.25265 type:complete len:204 (-) Transcript_11927:243-854(-)